MPDTRELPNGGPQTSNQGNPPPPAPLNVGITYNPLFLLVSFIIFLFTIGLYINGAATHLPNPVIVTLFLFAIFINVIRSYIGVMFMGNDPEEVNLYRTCNKISVKIAYHIIKVFLYSNCLVATILSYYYGINGLLANSAIFCILFLLYWICRGELIRHGGQLGETAKAHETWIKLMDLFYVVLVSLLFIVVSFSEILTCFDYSIEGISSICKVSKDNPINVSLEAYLVAVGVLLFFIIFYYNEFQVAYKDAFLEFYKMLTSIFN